MGQLSQSYEVEMVFVNDGSKDDTERLLKDEFKGEERVQVVSHEVNKGLGAAIRTGFQHATGDVIVTTDFDGTYPLHTIPELLQRMAADNTDIITASPYHPNGHVEGVPQYRLVFSFGASLLYRLLVRWNIHTWTALYRGYRRRVIETVTFENNGFLAGTELLINAIHAGFTVSEYPTTLHVRTFGQSSLKIARVTRSHLEYQFQLLKQAIFGKPGSSSTTAVKRS
jgi:dolichol-phosphate mannosyltransferase